MSMDSTQEQFDDPALRSAIRRAVGKPAAPSRLRDNVAAMMASAAIAQSSAVGASRWPQIDLSQLTLRAVTVAAVVLISIGVAGYQVHDFYREFSPASPSFMPPTLSASLTSSITTAHANFARKSDEHVVQ